MNEREKYEQLKQLSSRATALRQAMDAVRNGDTPDVGKWVSYKSCTQAYNRLSTLYVTISGDNSVTVYPPEVIRDFKATTWLMQKNMFDTVYIEVVGLEAILSQFSIGKSASVSEVQDLLTANLRAVMFDRPDRELQVQNAIEGLLVGRGYQKGISYDRESGKFRFSGKEFIPDFIFQSFSLALEVKLIKDHSQISNCVEEMSADATAYLSQYNNVLFCVYDLGAVRDITELQRGLEQKHGIRVCVVKH